MIGFPYVRGVVWYVAVFLSCPVDRFVTGFEKGLEMEKGFERIP